MHKIIQKIKINIINNALFSNTKHDTNNKKYLEWADYKNQIDVLDTMLWQQKIRKQNIKKAWITKILFF